MNQRKEKDDAMRYTNKVLLTLSMILLLVGCSRNMALQDLGEDSDLGTGYLKAERGNYNSIDTAIVVKYDLEEYSITLRNIEVGKDYTLTYNMDTTITDQYDEHIAMNQIVVGDIVDVTFMKEQKWLNTITISPSAWKYTNITNFRIDELQESLYVASDIYRLYGNVVTSSKENLTTLLDINPIDQITVKGIGQTIYSVAIERAHGYLRLENTDFFEGGWVEVGQDVISLIVENMLLLVPEGVHDVRISKNGVSGIRQIVIEENQEARFDISEFNGEETRIGKILFTVTPLNAIVTIDGEVVDISQVLEFDYGIHQMVIQAEGYQTISQFLKIGEDIASIGIEMEKVEEENSEEENSEEENAEEGNSEEEEEKDSTEENETVSGDNVIGGSTVDGYVVRIDAPEGVQVYLNGAYIGIAPVSFEKVEGVHNIILKQTGYEMRTHTIDVDNSEKDVSYAFSNLTPSS